MTISVECPHCEALFHLKPVLLGKAIPCPECRIVFTVTTTDDPHDSPTRIELPYERVEPNPTFVRPTPPAPEPARPAPEPPRPAPTLPAAQALPTAKPLPMPNRPQPREVVWDAGILAPPPASSSAPPPVSTAVLEAPAATESPETDADAEFIRRRPRRRSVARPLFFGLLAATVIGLGLSVAGVFRVAEKQEESAAGFAQKSYDDGDYPTAQEQFTTLANDFPTSANRDRYEFLGALSAAQVAASRAGQTDDPGPVRTAFESFVTTHGNHPLARPGTEGFAADVFSVGQRAATAGVEFATMRLDRFRQNRVKLEELSAAETAAAEVRAFLPSVERFTSPGGLTLADVTQQLSELERKFGQERHRLSVLEPFRDLATDPTAPAIERFEQVLALENLSTDTEALQMIASAEARLRSLLVYKPDAGPAVDAPVDGSPPIVFSAPLPAAVGETLLPFPTPIPTGGAVAFAADRGLLMAFDAASGEPLWGIRFAPPTAPSRAAGVPVPVLVGGAPTVLVTGDAGAGPVLTARRARTGEAVWQQSLAAPPAGQPLAIGSRIYMPLADERGTVLEFDAASGAKLGELAIRQPLGADLAFLPTDRPGGALLFVPADTKRLFVWELGREAPDGSRLPPRCVRVMLTGHPRDSLRSAPLIVGEADRNDPGPLYVVLTQAAGPATMVLRAVALLPPAALIAQATNGPAEGTESAADVTVPGWAWYPPVSDGERVLVATDAGAVVAFGANQVGNADAPLFSVPGPAPAAAAGEVSRAQVVAAGEDAVWVVLGGRLIRLRTAADSVSGFRLVSQGAGRTIGEPVQRPQNFPQLDLSVLTTRSLAGLQIAAVDLTTGRVRWQRRLGVNPAGPPVTTPDGVLVASRDGAIYRIEPQTEGAAPTVVGLVPPDPAGSNDGSALLATDGVGFVVLAITDNLDEARRARVRFVRGNKAQQLTLPMPDALAGPPVLRGDTVYIPLQNGYVYRATPQSKQWEVGPGWRGERAGGTACQIGLTGVDELLIPDGHRSVNRWQWPPSAKPMFLRGPWEVPNPIALPPLALPDNRLLLADTTGAISLFAEEKLVRRWTPGAEAALPAGLPTGAFTLLNTDGKQLVGYTIAERIVVMLDVASGPVWVANDLPGPLRGWAVDSNGVRVTLPDGTVRILNLSTGETVSEVAPGPVPPTTTAVPFGANQFLLFTADGAAAVFDAN